MPFPTKPPTDNPNIGNPDLLVDVLIDHELTPALADAILAALRASGVVHP